MARNSIPKTGGASKFRMVVIDAELQEGELGQLVQAIQGAFGAQRVTAARLNGSTVRSLPNPDTDEIPPESGDGEYVEDAGEEVIAPAPRAVRPRSQKKSRTPKLDNSLHPQADPSFKAYAEVAVSMNFGPLVLTDSGPPPGV